MLDGLIVLEYNIGQLLYWLANWLGGFDENSTCSAIDSGCDYAFLLFFRLFNTEGPYEFRQDLDQIVSIEILKNIFPYELSTMKVIMTIDPSLHSEVVNGLLEIPGGRVVLDPPTKFGPYIFRITYQDGECELIGKYNNGYVTPNGKLYVKNYSFDKEQFDEFLSSFLGG